MAEVSPGRDDTTLAGRDAWQWFSERRDPVAAHLLETAALALPRAFGQAHIVGAFVPRRPLRRRGWDFFLAVQGRPDRHADWERLVDFNEEILERTLPLWTSPDRPPRLLERFHAVLALDPPDAIPASEILARWWR